MPDSLDGGIVMGQALPKSTLGKLYHVTKSGPKTTWHYDWRGHVYITLLRVGAAFCAGAALWYLTPLHVILH